MHQHSRSQARMLALQALCLYEAQGPGFEQEIDGFLRDTVAQHDLGFEKPLLPQATSFARQLASGAWRGRGEYDRLLGAVAHGWQVKRMPPVDRNVLRLGIHELLEHPDRPPRVVINEAIELARRFGDAESAHFVNGVLDAVRKAAGIGITPEGGGE